MRKILAFLVALAPSAPAWALPPTVQPAPGQQLFPATGAPTPRTAADRAADVFSAADWGVVCNGGGDYTTQVQALINAAAAVNGKVIFPRGVCQFGPITVPANTAIEIAGQGMGSTTLQETASTTDFLTFASSSIAVHYVHDITIRGASWLSGQAGSCIALPTWDGTGGYGRGVWVQRVSISNCAQNDLNVQSGRGAGLVEDSIFQHANGDIFTISGAPDWRIKGTDFGAVNSGFTGNCLTASNTSDLRVDSNHFYNCTNGASVSQPGGAATFWLNNSFDTNNQSGFVFSSSGVPNGTVLLGNRFVSNSQAATGTYPDISISNTSGLIVNANTFFYGGTQSSYLIYGGTGAGAINWGINQYGFVNGTLPYAVGVSNNPSLVSVASGSQAILLQGSSGSSSSNTGTIAGGNNAVAGNAYGIAIGNNVTESGRQSAVFGRFANDQGRNGCFVYGNTQFTTQGDIGAIRCPMGVATTSTTAGTLTTDTGAPGSTNVLELPNDGEALVCRAGVVIVNNPGTSDYALWNLPAFTLKRGTGKASVTLSGITAGTQAQTSATAALTSTSLSVSADTINGGITIAGTGIASTTLHWGYVADCLDIK